MPKYNLMGTLCYRLWCTRTSAWRYIPVARWRRMTSAERVYYKPCSPYMPNWLMGGGWRAR